MRSLIIGITSTVLAFGLMGCTNPGTSQAQTPNPQVVQTDTAPAKESSDDAAADKDIQAAPANGEKSAEV